MTRSTSDATPTGSSAGNTPPSLATHETPDWVRLLLERQAQQQAEQAQAASEMRDLLKALLQRELSAPPAAAAAAQPQDATTVRAASASPLSPVPDFAQHAPVREPKLKPDEIAAFNPEKGDDVESFCRRIEDMTALHGPSAVSAVLPQCLRGTAVDWYTNLDEVTIASLRASTQAWVRLLKTRFGMSKTQAHSELVDLRYDLRTDYNLYHEKKIRLARIAGVHDVDNILQLILRGLPPAMRSALAAHAKGQTVDLDLFRRQCLGLRSTILDLRASPRFAPAPNSAALPAHRGPQPARPLPVPRSPLPRYASKPPPRPCRHCQGSHWDNECPRNSTALVPIRAGAPVVAAHHADDMPVEIDDSTYEAMEYEHMQSQALGSPDLDTPDLSFSSEESREDSYFAH